MKTKSPDTIWYLLLPVMEKYHIEVSRKYFKTLLRNICDKFGKKRSEIGVITGARAEMYFEVQPPTFLSGESTHLAITYMTKF